MHKYPCRTNRIRRPQQRQSLGLAHRKSMCRPRRLIGTPTVLVPNNLKYDTLRVRAADEVVPDMAQATRVVGGFGAVGGEGVDGAGGGGLLAREDVGPEEPGHVGETVEGGEDLDGFFEVDAVGEDLLEGTLDVEGDDDGGGADELEVVFGCRGFLKR